MSTALKQQRNLSLDKDTLARTIVDMLLEKGEMERDGIYLKMEVLGYERHSIRGRFSELKSLGYIVGEKFFHATVLAKQKIASRSN